MAPSRGLSAEPATEGWRSVIEEADELLRDPPFAGFGAVGNPTPSWQVAWRTGVLARIQEAGREAAGATRRIEIGARVLKGNTDQDFVRVAGEIVRERGNSLRLIEWGGRYGQVNGDRNTNRWYIDHTVDYLQPGGWIFYIGSKHEYNEFQGIDYRGTGSIGVGYRFVDEEDRRVVMRVGPAVTLEIYSHSGGQRRTEDLFAEFEIDWPLFERTRLETKTTMRPSVIGLDVFRFRSDTAVLVPLDDDARWSLKLGFLLDYNSSLDAVSNRLPMDLTTNVSIVYLRP